MHPTRSTPRALALISVVSLAALVACGDDDESTTGATDTADTADATTDADATATGSAADFCDAALAIETAPGPDVDFDAASEAEIADAARAWGSEVLRPLADDVVASAPDEIAAEVEVISATVDRIADTGDLDAFEVPETAAAAETYNSFAAEECGWATVEVTAVDYGFEGLPTELPAGPTRLTLTNEGNELHELMLFRRNEGADQPVEELLQLSDEARSELVTPVGDPAFAPPQGAGEPVVYDLQPGSYIAVCLVPVGLTSEDATPSPQAAPHTAEGMVAEITVEG